MKAWFRIFLQSHFWFGWTSPTSLPSLKRLFLQLLLYAFSSVQLPQQRCWGTYATWTLCPQPPQERCQSFAWGRSPRSCRSGPLPDVQRLLHLISWQISTRFHLSVWTQCSLCAICNQDSRFLLALKPHASCCGDSGFIIYSGEKLWKAYERYPSLYIFYFYHNLSLLKKKQLFDWVKKVWMIIWVKLSVEYILTNFVRLCKQEGTILFKKVRLMLNSTPKFQTFNDK